ncbi:MAG: selenocysteine-specific translation elongation factor, partial [Acidimicrobiales bacterium]
MSTTAARPPALRPGLVLGTAGHVDHGKSTLIQALTGTDPDRLAEEKARGLTIDLGFAAMKLASGRTVSFVDVPGHVRFIKNMLAGAGAVDACLFVVSAVEGWKPQSEEHLRILELLGLETGVVALTMADRVSREEQAAATAAVQDRLRTSFLAMAPVVPVGSVTGQGLDRLGDVLDKLVTRLPAARDRGRPRLWIDRAFPVAGAGAVVTGTLVDGSLHVGQNLDVVPGGRTVRVRGLQSHGAAYGSAGPGNRVAVNLSGAGHAELARGQALVVQDQWWPASSFDVRLRVLDGLGHGVGRRGAYRLHVGSADLPIR